ncbi:MAG: helix-hairpin-helix domain-containing protein [Prevotella sp.]|nr:helix-hairpin-helix domain-containing protein [Prevotella sp.]
MRRSDRNIAITALIVAAMILVGIYLAGHYEIRRTDGYAADSITARSANVRRSAKALRYYAAEVERVAETFDFDPNTADSTQLLRLGLQPWQVRNIYRYRAKGGIYRTKEDFARVYGLTIKDYRRLEPHIHISRDYQPAASLVGERKPVEKDTVRYPIKVKADEHIVLNTADTTALKKVPGIGSYYAKEIYRYGQRLGGYVSTDQLDEIDDFPQESKRYFVVADAAPRKLNVNKLTLQQLRRHPYINFYQAKAITDYRRLHGPLKSLDDLRLSSDFSDEAIRRLEPYVEY